MSDFDQTQEEEMLNQDIGSKAQIGQQRYRQQPISNVLGDKGNALIEVDEEEKGSSEDRSK